MTTVNVMNAERKGWLLMIEVDENKGVKIDEYEGKVFLASAWKNRDGKVKINWCKVGPKDKLLPVKVLIGSTKEKAIETIAMIYKRLTEDGE